MNIIHYCINEYLQLIDLTGLQTILLVDFNLVYFVLPFVDIELH